MSRNTYNFNGGDELATMGASWFVAYYWYEMQDSSCRNWQRVPTCDMRIAAYERSKRYHSAYLKEILEMNTSKLDTNTLGLSGIDIQRMAFILLHRTL